MITVLDFPVLAAGMTRGNMFARLHYQSLVDPTLVLRVTGWEHDSLGTGREGIGIN